MNKLVLTNMMECLGGWVPDNQFIIQNNTVPVMAHGLGKPVEDAYTSIQIEETAVGAYKRLDKEVES